jgi:hypothetical protein
MDFVTLKDQLDPYFDNLDHIVNEMIRPKVRGHQFKLFDACRFKIKYVWYIQKRIDELDKQYREFLLLCIARNSIEKLSLTQIEEFGADYFFYFPFFEGIEFKNLLAQGKACLDLFAKGIGSIYRSDSLPKNIMNLIKILKRRSGDQKVDRILKYIYYEHKIHGVVVDPVNEGQKALRDLVVHSGRTDIFFSIKRDEKRNYNLSKGALVNMRNPQSSTLSNYPVTEIAAKVWLLILGIIENCFKIQFEDNFEAPFAAGRDRFY